MQRSSIATVLFYTFAVVMLCIFGCGLYSAGTLDAEYIGITVLDMAISALAAIVSVYILYKIVLKRFKS